MERKINYKLLLPALIVPLLTAGLAAYIIKDDFAFYELLHKPLLSPPAGLFPVVWTALYIMMGIASYLVAVSESSRQRKDRALKAYGIQLVLNFLWPILFFRFEMFALALLCAVLLLGAVLICYVFFVHISQTAGKLLLPYLLWTAFALYLNTGIVLLN